MRPSYKGPAGEAALAAREVAYRQRQAKEKREREEANERYERGRREKLESYARDHGTTADALRVEEAAAQNAHPGDVDSGFSIEELRRVWKDAGNEGEMPRHWYKTATDIHGRSPNLRMSVGGEQAYKRIYEQALAEYEKSVQARAQQGDAHEEEQGATAGV